MSGTYLDGTPYERETPQPAPKISSGIAVGMSRDGIMRAAVVTGPTDDAPGSSTGGVTAIDRSGLAGKKFSIVGDGPLQVTGPQSHSPRIGDSSDPLDHATTQHGSPVSRDAISPETLVDFAGATKVSTLVQMGALRRTASGYEWTESARAMLGGGNARPFDGASQAEQQQAAPSQDQQQEPTSEALVRLSDTTERTMQAVFQKVGETATSALVETMIRGNGPDKFVHEFASRLSMEPEETAAMISSVHGEFVSQAQQATGITDAEEWAAFTEWANTGDRRERTINAIHRQVDFADLRAVKKLAREFQAAGSNYTDEDILAAELGDGVTAYREADGKVLLRIAHEGQGQSMPWRQAMQMGYLRVSRR